MHINKTQGYCLFVFVAALSLPWSLAKASLQAKASNCTVESAEDWNQQERLVWHAICQGKSFDFNDVPGYGGDLEAVGSKSWPAERKLSEQFLRTVLFDEKYASVLTNRGVRILGAWFDEEIDFSNAEVKHDLWLEKSRFDAPVTLFNAKFAQSLSLDFSRFSATVTLKIASISGVLSLGGVVFEKTLDLSGANIGADVAILMGAKFKDAVSLANAKIAGALYIQDSSFDNYLASTALTVEQDTLIHNAEFAGRVDMGLSGFGGLFQITSSKFADVLDLSSIMGRFDIYFDGVEFEKDIEINSSEIGNDLKIVNIKVGRNLYLRGTRTGGNLSLEKSDFSGAVFASNLIVKSQIFVKSNSFSQKVVMQKAETFDSVFIHDNRFNDGFALNSSSLGDQLEISGNNIKGLLYLDSIKLKKHLLLRNSNFDGEVSVSQANLGGQLGIESSDFHGKLKAEDTKMSNLYISDSTFADELQFLHAQLSGGVIIANSMFDKLLYFGHSSTAKASVISKSKLSGPLSFASAELGGRLIMYENFLNDEVDFAGIKISDGLFIRSSRFRKDVDLDRAVVNGTLSISDNSKFEARVDLEDVVVSNSLFIHGNTEFARELNANAISVGGNFELVDCFFKGEVSLEYAKVAGSIVLGASSVFSAGVSLSQATVLGQLSMEKAHFKAPLNLEGIRAGMVFLGTDARFDADVSLAAATVDIELSASQSRFKGFLGLSVITIGHNLVLGDSASFEMPISVNRGQIAGDVSFPSSNLFFADFSGSVIGGVLDLGVNGDDDPVWSEEGGVDLGNARVDTIQVPTGWDIGINLDGLEYDHLGGELLLDEKPMLQRHAEWFINFLERQESYSPQPYKFLADKLKELGQFEKSSEILYAGRDRERRNAGMARWAWLSIQKYLIGYGIGSHIFAVCYWILLFVIVGTIVIRHDEEGRKEGRDLLWSIFYSIDKLLPIISLDSEHQALMPDGKARYYYYFHIFSGYVLALFLVAGISGLTNQ